MLGLLGACGALSTTLATVPAHAAEGSDWQHALRVASNLRADPPDEPVVLLLGGSCAREATVSDESWSSTVRKLSESRVLAYNLASRNQTFEQSAALVKALPRIPMIVFIGVNRDRFASPPTTTASTTPRAAKSEYVQHHYTCDRIQSRTRKEQRVDEWLSGRYPVFKSRYDTNLARLAELLATCKRRGHHPVILDLPRNMEIIGDAFDEPIRQYQAGATELAARHAIPFLDFVDDLSLANDDFYDLDHLVDPGWPKYEKRLATETALLLDRYDMRSSGEWNQDILAAAVARVRSRPVQALAILAVLLAALLAAQRRRVVLRRRRAARRRQWAERSPRSTTRVSEADRRRHTAP